MTNLRCLILCLSITGTFSSEPLTYTINTKKWSHVLDDHFISVTINPTDLLQGKAFGLGLNSTISILKGLSPAYIRIGSADTGKYTFKRSRHSADIARAEDEIIITESHWTILNEVARSADLDVIVCLNAAHRNGASNKWDTRNSLELISFSDSQGYNLTFQLGYEVQRSSGISGHQYGKDLNRLRTILNAFPRYQTSKLIGPDIRFLNKKEDIDFVNEVLTEAGPVIDAVTWHPRWPQPSKMKVSDVSELGYEFPSDYIEWDRSHLSKVLQRSILRTPIWIGEPKTESTGTFAEGLLWAKRLVLAARLGIEVVMKQPSLMDITHPKPEYWIAYLHKRLLGKATLETRSMNNQTEIAVITHCTNALFWAERQNKAIEGAVTVYAVNMGGKEQRVHLKGSWGGKSQIMLQYLLTSGSDPDSVFSQMTYLNGEPLMMTDDGDLPDIVPRIKRIDKGVTMKLPSYSVGFWVIPEAKVKVCQVQGATTATPAAENLSSSNMIRNSPRIIPTVRNLNQLIVDKLKNPVSDSDEDIYDDGMLNDDSDEKLPIGESIESQGLRTSRRVREVTVEDIGQELKEKIREIRDMLENKETNHEKGIFSSQALRAAEEKINSLTDELGSATRLTDQQEEFGRFLHQAGLNQNFGDLMVNERTGGLPGLRRSTSGKNPWIPMSVSQSTIPLDPKIRRFRRSLSYPEDDYEEESIESYSSEEEIDPETKPDRKIDYRKRIFRPRENSDESSDHSSYSGPSSMKGLEEKYKSFISYRVQDGKKRLNDVRKQKKDEVEDSRKGKKSNLLANDLQEEILMKEVEVLQKTEEAMANFIKNHKKRAQTIEEIILHEITDIKEDRLLALEDIRLHKRDDDPEAEDEKIGPQKTRRNVLDFLTPKKEKRSIAEVDSTVNAIETTTDRKSKITKRAVDSSYERPYAKRKSRKANRNNDNSFERGKRPHHRSRSERLERMKNFIQSRERIRDRNLLKKKHNRHRMKLKLFDSGEESNEVLGKYKIGAMDKAEEAVIKELQREVLKKSERKAVQEEVKQMEKEENPKREEKNKNIPQEEKKTENMDYSKNNSGNGNSKKELMKENDSERHIINENQNPKAEVKKQENDQGSKSSTKKIKEEQVEYIPLKIDKDRGLNVLKRISNLVENINTREKARSKKPSSDVEDLSEEFFGDALSKITKRRPRRSHHKEGDENVDEIGEVAAATDDLAEEPTVKDAKTRRKEARLRRLQRRRNRYKKLNDNDNSNREDNESKLEAKFEIPASVEVTTIPITESSTTTEKTPTKMDEEVMVQETGPDVKDEKQQEKSEGKVDLVTLKKDENRVGKFDNVEEKTTVAADIPSSTTESIMTEKSTPTKEIIKEPQMSDTVLFIPEVDDYYYNPIIVAGEDDNTRLLQDVVMNDPRDEVVVVDPYHLVSYPTNEELPEAVVKSGTDLVNRGLLEGGGYSDPAVSSEAPVESSNAGQSLGLTEETDIVRVSQRKKKKPEAMNSLSESEESEDSQNERYGPPDLIEELMEGEYLKPWKGAELREVSNKENKEDEAVEKVRLKNGEISNLKESESGEGSYEIGKSEKSQESSMDEPSIRHIPSVEEEESSYANKSQEKVEKKKARSLRRSRRGILDRRLPTPEERIRNFKRVVHRRHSPFGRMNELPVPDDRNSFWKMAGSTVKAVFNDVIPEAYGKTKDKIENLGIAEYFKEFGKIVEQMKNLDKIFANIGQAAVRNYIKGTEVDKGENIQVIEKRRRSRRDTEDVLQTDTLEEATSFKDEVMTTTTITNNNEVTTIPTTVEKVETTTPPPTTSAEPTGTGIKAKGLKTYDVERPSDLIRDIFLMDSNPGIVEVTKSVSTTEQTPRITLQPFRSRYAKMPNFSLMHNKLFTHKTMKDANRLLPDRDTQSKELDKFAPWMKTTQDFINQALTTLQRQKELSEMIARESVNDLVKREIEKKVIGKREISDNALKFPVYHVPSNKKREIYGKAEDSMSRHLTRLQPGVYIVPTEDMKNLRSEQVTKEASATRPGMPNVVTLNIYYDKKKPDEWEESLEEIDPEKVSSEYLSYYPGPGLSWSPIPPAHKPPIHYGSEVIETGFLPSGIPMYPTEGGIHFPEPLPDWISTTQRGYSMLQRGQPHYYFPNSSPFPQSRSDWADFKSHHTPATEANPQGGNAENGSGWAVQFQPAKKKPSRVREPLKAIDRTHRTLPDKKRSVGNDKNFAGLVLPFWKILNNKKDGNEPTGKPVEKKISSKEGDSVEELFAENRRRARQKEAQMKGQKVATERNPELSEEEKEDGAEKSRRRRDITLVEQYDLVPDWLGTVQDLDNTLHDHEEELERLTRLVSTMQFNHDDDMEQIIPSDHFRHRRSVDAPEAASRKTGRSIFETNLSGTQPKSNLKKLEGEDSSLEVPAKKGETTVQSTETSLYSISDGSADHALPQFFKYAYESLIQMMKGMTEFI